MRPFPSIQCQWRAASFLLACLVPATLEGDVSENQTRLEETIQTLNTVILDDPDAVRAYQARGVAHFELAAFEEAIADLDRVVELFRNQEPHHWQRGIAYYYAGEYEKGVRQFELHQTVNRQDVENAVWHFICKTRISGTDAARESLIPIGRDSRIPMAEIWSLFSGDGSPEEVLHAADPTGEGSQSVRPNLCYAHLYIGLYHEAFGNTELAKKHIRLAATTYGMDHYMGMVARVHFKLLGR